MVELVGVLPELNITSLCLDFNRIDDVACGILAMTLPNTKITDLSLAYNRIEKAGCISLAAFLPKSRVSVLNMCCNWIGKMACEILVSILPTTDIYSMNVAWNHISGDVQYITRLLQTNYRITKFKPNSKEIEKILDRNKKPKSKL